MKSAHPASANPYFVDHLIDLSQVNTVLATEDIYSTTGVKLLAKGTEITHHLRDRLLSHKLEKPLEICLQAGDPVNGDELSLLAREIAEQRPELDALCGLGAGLTGAEGGNERRWWSLAYLRAVPLDTLSLLLLTMGRRERGLSLRHAVLVTLIALGLGRRLHLSEEMLRQLTTAALLHDVGELYVDPRTFAPGHHVSIAEWRGITAHPLVGYKLLHELPGIGPHTTRSILEHHERWDGSGYPRGIAGNDISQLGQLLAAAEMAAGLLGKSGQAIHRVIVALKALSPGLSPDVLSALRASLAMVPPEDDCSPQAGIVVSSLGETAQLLKAVDLALSKAEVDAESVTARELILDVENLFTNIQRAFRSSGPGSLPLDDVAALLTEPDARELLHETADVCDEIRWRLRELSRSTVSRVARIPEGDQAALPQLLAAMQIAW